MTPLNYCRQMVKQFAGTITTTGFPEKNKGVLSHAIELARLSQKFMLPCGGRLYDDPEYRALDENEPLCLPYPIIALEYARQNDGTLRDGEVFSPKSIVFARQLNDVIVVMPVYWAVDMWLPLPELGIPRTGYIDRTVKKEGRVSVCFSSSDNRVPYGDYADELGALLCFLNVLRCQNVHVERRDPKNHGKKVKVALPFDTYHILTIDIPSTASSCGTSGGHRSPREHLRRGHIRRLPSGRRVWVNATVVAAGRGRGVVVKDYAIQAKA